MLDNKWHSLHQCRLASEVEILEKSCQTDVGQGTLPRLRVFSDRVREEQSVPTFHGQI